MRTPLNFLVSGSLVTKCNVIFLILTSTTYQYHNVFKLLAYLKRNIIVFQDVIIEMSKVLRDKVDLQINYVDPPFS